jgi:hypothetical protein
MKKKRQNLRLIRLGIILILMILIVDLVFTIKLSTEVKSTITDIQKDKLLPCAAVPTKYIYEEPECADKLLRAMNVTRVRILSKGQPQAVQ